jgi:hypothetical protein
LRTIFFDVLNDIIDWLPSWKSAALDPPRSLNEFSPWVVFIHGRLMDLWEILTKQGRGIYVGVMLFIFAAILGSM